MIDSNPPQLRPLVPERYAPSDVLDWLRYAAKAPPELTKAWMKKVSEDAAIPFKTRVELLVETILDMTQDLLFFTPKGSNEERAATEIIKIAEYIQYTQPQNISVRMDDRDTEVLKIILADMAEQKYGPGNKIPVATIQQRALAKGIMNMGELQDALNLGVKCGLFLYMTGSPKGLGLITLTEEGYSESNRYIEPAYTSNCPFCGSYDVMVELREDGMLIDDPKLEAIGRYTAYATVCNDCGARGPIVKVQEDGTALEKEEKAFSLWAGGIKRNRG